MPLTTGPCRTGQYAIFYQSLFQELGYKNVVVPRSTRTTATPSWGAASTGAPGLDHGRRLHARRPRRPAGARRRLGAGGGGARPHRPRDGGRRGEEQRRPAGGPPAWAARLKPLPLKKPLATARRVLIVGEIFVRRDDYSVDTLVKHLAEKQIVAKITSLSEWTPLPRLGPGAPPAQEARRAAPAPARGRAGAAHARVAAVEKWWKHRPGAPHRRGVEGERPGAGVAPRHGAHHGALAAVHHAGAGERGVAVALRRARSPSTRVRRHRHHRAVRVPARPAHRVESRCPGRARGHPGHRHRDDGNPYPPNVISRLEIFAHNVDRGMRKAAPDGDAVLPVELAPASAHARGGNGNGEAQRLASTTEHPPLQQPGPSPPRAPPPSSRPSLPRRVRPRYTREIHARGHGS